MFSKPSPLQPVCVYVCRFHTCTLETNTLEHKSRTTRLMGCMRKETSIAMNDWYSGVNSLHGYSNLGYLTKTSNR